MNIEAFYLIKCLIVVTLFKENDVAALIQPLLDSNRDFRTIFNIQNFNGGTINTGLTLEDVTLTRSATCSGTSCRADNNA